MLDDGVISTFVFRPNDSITEGITLHDIDFLQARENILPLDSFSLFHAGAFSESKLH